MRYIKYKNYWDFIKQTKQIFWNLVVFIGCILMAIGPLFVPDGFSRGGLLVWFVLFIFLAYGVFWRTHLLYQRNQFLARMERLEKLNKERYLDT
jgi:hypothetical protein